MIGLSTVLQVDTWTEKSGLRQCITSSTYAARQKGILNFFFNDHNSHCYPNAINLNHMNHVRNLFLKAGNSEKDQPNNNGPNACLKAVYIEKKEISCEEYRRTTFTPPHMNYILKHKWEIFQQRCAHIIVRTFTKCLLLPLQALTEDDNMSGGAVSISMKCAVGKNATELSII